MDLIEVIKTAKAEAILRKFNPTEESQYRKSCREYSKIFNMPLDKVFDMDPYTIYFDLFSEQIEKVKLDDVDNINDILDQLHSIKDPDYDAAKEKAYRKELQDIVEEEERRLALGEAIHPSLEKKDSSKPIQAKKEIPKSGGINMDLIKQLQNEENESGDF